MNLILALLIGYLIGGIPTGILISRAVAGVDPRSLGSGSSGATNVSRIIGKKWAILVLLLDALKGYIPAAVIAPFLSSHGQFSLVQVCLALGTVIGHVWTPYARFRGGKGVATAAGAILAMDPISLLIAFIVWSLLFAVCRRVSVASLAAALTVPATMVILGGRPKEVVAATVFLALFLVFTHRQNIQRLLKGSEKPIA